MKKLIFFLSFMILHFNIFAQETPEYLAGLRNYAKDFKEYEIGHFKVRLTDNDLILKPYLEENLETIYQHIGKIFNCFPQDKVLIEVYPSRESFAFASTLGDETVERSGAIGICKFNRLMLASPSTLPQGYRWIDTICHEYTHFIINRVSNAGCPLWLHEGIARYYDTSWRKDPPQYMTSGNANVFADAIKQNKLIPFSRMAPSMVYLKDQDEVNLAFIEVSNSIDFMNKNYPEKIVKLLQNMGIGDNSEEKAFKNVLGCSIDKFEKLWQKNIRKLSIQKTAGAVSDKIRWKKYNEVDEFVGVNARDYVRLGDRFKKNNNFEVALIQYNKALALEPFNPVVLYKKSRTLLSLGKIDDAEAALTACIDKNPNYVSPYELLGELYLNKKNFKKAREMLIEAASINPFNPFSRANLEFAKTQIKQNP
ncbi:MAG: tetratricopeptide repeat protein [Elusimicrobia bacterium]|nr:tetratricopeptide repeat protein [Elusimicrobiota bacterium]